MNPPDETGASGAVDPEDFLRALLKISPEDAEEVRRDAAAATEHGGDDDGAGDNG